MSNFKIFISYSTLNKALVDKFSALLRVSIKASGEIIECWRDKDEINPGDEWDKKIKKALETADIIICALSEPFFSSNYINNVELPIAWEKHINKKAIFVPLNFIDYDYPEKWKELESIQVFKKSAEFATLAHNVQLDDVHNSPSLNSYIRELTNFIKNKKKEKENNSKDEKKEKNNSTNEQNSIITVEQNLIITVKDLLNKMENQVKKRELVTIKITDSIAGANVKMYEGKFRHLPIVDNNLLFVRMLSIRDVLSNIGERPTMSNPKFNRPHKDKLLSELETIDKKYIKSISDKDDIKTLIGLLTYDQLLGTDKTSKVSAVPVLDENNKVIDVISYIDVLKFHQFFKYKTEKYKEKYDIEAHVKDQSVDAASIDDTLSSVISDFVQMMKRRTIPILDENEQYFGLASDIDLQKLKIENKGNSKLGDNNFKKPEPLPYNVTNEDLARAFIKDRFTSLPIKDDDGSFQGMLSYTEYLKHLEKNL